MSLDDEIRGYERALLRSGQDPQAVAAKMLGVADRGRFLLLFQRVSGVTEREQDLLALIAKSRRVTGQHYGLQPRHEHLYALPVVTIEEAVAAQDALAGRSHSWLWDQLKSVENDFGDESAATFSRIEEGWALMPWETASNPHPLRRWEAPVPLEVRPFGDGLPSRDPKDNPLA